MDKSIEAAAEAYYYAVVGELGAHASWDEFTEDEKAYHTEKMRAAIAAYRDAEIADLRAKLEAAERDVKDWRTKYYTRIFEDLADYLESEPWLADTPELRPLLDRLADKIDAARGGERG